MKVYFHLLWCGVLGLYVQRVLLVMSEHLEHNGVCFNVINERAGHRHGEVLNVVEAQRRTLAGVFQGFGRESFVVSVKEAAKLR